VLWAARIQRRLPLRAGGGCHWASYTFPILLLCLDRMCIAEMKSVWDTQDGSTSPNRIPGPRYTHCIAQSQLEDIKSILPSFKGPSSTSSASSSSSALSSWLNDLPVRVPDDPVVVGLLSALGGVALAFGGIAGYRRFWRRIKNSNDVSQRMLDGRKWVKGRVTSVGDGGECFFCCFG
jgi:hypothetical protein